MNLMLWCMEKECWEILLLIQKKKERRRRKRRQVEMLLCTQNTLELSHQYKDFLLISYRHRLISYLLQPIWTACIIIVHLM